MPVILVGLAVQFKLLDSCSVWYSYIIIGSGRQRSENVIVNLRSKLLQLKI